MPADFVSRSRVAFGLRALALTLAAGALYRLSFAFSRLWFDYLDWANVDLRFFHRLVGEWFAGETLSGSVYPPATYAMLWPLLGWLEVPGARLLWGATSIVLLAALALLIARDAPAASRAHGGAWAGRLSWGLLPAAGYATSATIGNGQLGLHVMAPLLAGFALLARARPTWTSDLAAAVLILVSLSKPTISAPFFWIVIFAFGRWRPATLVAGGYAALSLFAAGLRAAALRAEVSTAATIGESVASGVRGTAIGSKEAGGGYANVHDWLTALGLESFNLPISLLLLGVLGVWVFRHRRDDLWILLGVAALAGRFWAYHRLHDDLMILPAVVALFRIAVSARDDWRTGAFVLGALVAAGSLVPAGLLFAPFPLGIVFDAIQTAVWGAALVFLVAWAGRGTRDEVLPIPVAVPAG